MRVLVVDDERLCRAILADQLAECGHEAIFARNGAEAWEQVRRDPEIALVITDWVMPEMEGPELCRRIRAMNRTPYLPVLLNTGSRQADSLAEGLSAGADAFLNKPVSTPALRAQLQVVERILRLEEKLRGKVRSLERAQERIRRDLEAAASVQRSHLPRRSPAIPGVDSAWVYDACESLGGDMFNVFRLDERHVGLYVLDVSGHGTSAALFSVSLSRALVPEPQHGGILKQVLPESPEPVIVAPAEVAAELNQRFQLIEESGRYCTFLYGVLDLEARRFRYVSAGHPGPVEITRDGAAQHRGRSGVPIGVLQDGEYVDDEIQLAPGSRLLLYTDGVTETVNARDEEFGEERLTLWLSDDDVLEGGVAEMVQSLRKELIDFAAGRPQKDDITIVGIGFRE